MDPRNNVMSELERQKNLLLKGKPMPPRTQGQFPTRVSDLQVSPLSSYLERTVMFQDPRATTRPEAAYMIKTDSKWGNTYLPVVPRMDPTGKLIGTRGTEFI